MTNPTFTVFWLNFGLYQLSGSLAAKCCTRKLLTLAHCCVVLGGVRILTEQCCRLNVETKSMRSWEALQWYIAVGSSLYNAQSLHQLLLEPKLFQQLKMWSISFLPLGFSIKTKQKMQVMWDRGRNKQEDRHIQHSSDIKQTLKNKMNTTWSHHISPMTSSSASTIKRNSFPVSFFSITLLSKPSLTRRPAPSCGPA